MVSWGGGGGREGGVLPPLSPSLLFSERNYKKQAQMFYQNNLLALHTVEIFCNLILRNRLKKNLGLPYWARVNFMIYWTWTHKKLELPYWTPIGFMIYWN